MRQHLGGQKTGFLLSHCRPHAGKELPCLVSQAVFLQKENHRFPDRNEDAAAERHFQDFHRHHHLSTDRRYRHGGLGFAKNVELRALVGSFDDFVVNE